jgi:hypothetical protein
VFIEDYTIVDEEFTCKDNKQSNTNYNIRSEVVKVARRRNLCCTDVKE